ncbi:MAG: gluconate 2-dehydrogenase subunit 3 family protein [Chitinophagaceae bacterium]
MNRKKAILSLFLIGGGATAGFSGYKWFSIHKTPDTAFLDNHKTLIASLAETIIPSTDTPGAREASVHLTIIAMIKEVADRKTKNIFIDGLKEVDEYASGKYNKAFTTLAAAEQVEVVSHFRDKGKNYAGIMGKIKNKIMGKSFFHVLKEYSTIAFCTSRPGATQTLSYDFIPGKYNACMPMAPGQKSWATK